MIPTVFIPKEAEPHSVIFMANCLGESQQNDQRYRAAVVAEEQGAMVVAYERPGTGSQSSYTFNLGLPNQLRPDNYAALAAQTGRILEAAVPASLKFAPRIHYGNSAGGVDPAAVARTETVWLDYLALGDPSGMQSMGKLQFGLRWLRQYFSEDKSSNSDEVPSEVSAPTISNKEMVIRAIPEIIRYNEVWRSVLTYANLQDIATRPEFGHIAVNLAMLTPSFTASRKNALVTTGVLNISVRSDRPAPFRASVIEERHSFFDDPRNVSKFIAETVALNDTSLVP